MSDRPAERMIAAALEKVEGHSLDLGTPATPPKADIQTPAIKTPASESPSAKAPLKVSKEEKPQTAKRARKTTPKSHYHGHRDRLRERFKTSGADALADYELLELYLFRSIARIDTKPIAKDLIARFGSFAEVIAAPIEQLVEVKYVTEKVALELKIIQAASVKLGRENVLSRPVLSSWSALLDYCRSAMQYERVEQFRVLFLDRKNRLIADEVLGRGTVDRAPVYPREIIKRALELEATAIILAHNHPSGDPTPSQSDIDMTKQIMDICKGLSVTVHDHLIIGRDNIASFKTLGLM